MTLYVLQDGRYFEAFTDETDAINALVGGSYESGTNYVYPGRYHDTLRLSAYSTTTTDGGMLVDVQGLMTDLIIVAKSDGLTLEMLLGQIITLFNEIEVQVTIPPSQAN